MKGRAAFAVKAALSLAILAVIATRVDLERTTGIVTDVGGTAVLVAMAIIVFQTLVTSWRWAVIMRGVDVPIGFMVALRAVYGGLAINQCLPSYVGGDAYRIYSIRSRGESLGNAFRGVLIDRVGAMIALVVMTAAATPVLLSWTSDPLVIDGLLMLVAAGATGAVSFFVCDLLPERWLATRVGRELANTSRAARRVLLFSPAAPVAAILAVLVHVLSGAILFVFASDLAAPLTLSDCLLLMPPITLLAAAPISIAGWGVREGVMVGALSLRGVATEQALALSLLLGLVLLCNGMIGLLPLMLDRSTDAAERAVS